MAEENTNAQQQPSENTEPAGASSGGGDPRSEPAANAGNNGPKPEPGKTADNSDTPSAEELAAFRKWQESQKSDAEKQAAAIGKAEKAKQAAEERAAAAELKLTAMSKGVAAEALNDVIALAKTKITDKVTAEQAIDEIVGKYPTFSANAPLTSTGTKTPNNHDNNETDSEKIRKVMGLPTKSASIFTRIHGTADLAARTRSFPCSSPAAPIS